MNHPLIRPKRHPGMIMLALEPRWMFDAAAAGDVVDAIADATSHLTQVQAVDTASNGGKREAVFIDSSVVEWQQLVAGLHAGVEVQRVDSSADGLAAIAAWAQTHSGYDSIAIISHGGVGWFGIGTSTVDNAALSDAATRSELAQLGQALKAEGSLLVYGCDVAKGDAGMGFLTALGDVVGRSVAASTDTTGSSGLGGDWVLEASIGYSASFTMDGGGWLHILAAPAFSETFTSQTSLSSSWSYFRSGWTGTYMSSTYGALLTNNGNGQSADLIYNQAFDSSSGIDLRFTYYMGPNTTGADGISFFLLDGTTSLVTSFNTGALGPGLGYAANVNEAGLSGGVLGVGIDLWGNYSGTAAGTGSPGPLNSNNSTYSGNIVLRGSGDEATSTTGYAYLTGVQPDSSGNPQTPGSGSTTRIAGEHAVEIILAINGGNGHYELTVKLDNITQINAYDLTAAGITVPSTLMFGFGASTGGATNTQSIKSVAVFTAAAAADAVWPSFTTTTPTSVDVESGTAFDLSSYLKASDTDSGQTLTWSQASAPSHGTLSIVGATASSGGTAITPGGTLTYTGTDGYVGTDSFIVQVSDGTTWATKTITVSVDKTPSFVNPTTTLTVENTAGAVNLADLLKASDTDSGQTLTWSQVSGASHGTLVVNAATASSGGTAITSGGTLTYQPASGYVGTDSFTISVSDGIRTVQRTITVTVGAPTPTSVVQSPIQTPVADQPSTPGNVSSSLPTTPGTVSGPTTTSTTSSDTGSRSPTATSDALGAAAALVQSLITPTSTGTITGTGTSFADTNAPRASDAPPPSSAPGLVAGDVLSPATTQPSAASEGATATTGTSEAAGGLASSLASGTATDAVANDAYSRALTNALAEGRPMAEAAGLAQQAAAAQAAAAAAAGDPNAALASGDMSALLGSDSGSALYQQALGAALARGANLAQAQAQAREAVAGLSGSGDPAVSLSEALASGKVAALTAGMSSSAAAAFEKTLSGALARGASVAESLAQARGAAAQADGMDGAARNNPLGELATGGKRTGTEGAAYDRALSAALAAGLPLDQAQARARDAARAMAAATGKLTEADALASGKRLDEVLGARAKDPVFMAAFNRALAAGKDVRLALAEADKAARDAKVSESNAADRLPEALATGKQVDPAKTPHSGELQGQAKALFDRVLGRTLQGGASLADSIKRANAAVAEFQAAEAAATSVPSPQFTPPRAQASR